MKRTCFIFAFSLLIVFLSNATSITVTGTISSDSTWTGVDTVFVAGDITISGGATLTIDPGTVVVFQGDYKIDVNGNIQAVGTLSDSIKFTAVDHNEGWQGIRIDGIPSPNDTMNISYCLFEYGNADGGLAESAGGAIYVDGFDKLVITKCIFQHNRADISGGGINLTHSNSIIRNCIFRNNDANTGSGLQVDYYSYPLVENSLFNANQGAGAIAFYNYGNGTVRNCTFENNEWGVRFSSNSTATIINTIISGSSSSNVMLNDDGSDPNFYYCNIGGGTSAFWGPGGGANFTGDYLNCIDTDAMFINSGEHAYDLSTLSPCINAGDPTFTTSELGELDLQDNPRFLNNRIDIGAYESPSGHPLGNPGHALEFDGLNDHVSIPAESHFNTTQFTVEFWIKVNDPGSWQGIVDKGRDSNSDWYFLTGGPGETEGVVFGTGNGTARDEVSYSWNDTLWHYIAGTYDGSAIKLFVDGHLRGSKNHGFSSTGNNITVGCRRSQSWYFEGVIDELLIWDHARNVDEIRTNLYHPDSVDSPGIVANWQLNEGDSVFAGDNVHGVLGTLTNMSDDDWVLSSIPFGTGSNHTEIVNATGVVNFTGTGISLDFSSKTGTDTIVAASIDTIPNIYPDAGKRIFNETYWVVDRYGGGSFSADITFTMDPEIEADYLEYPGLIELYTRGSNTDTSWMLLQTAVMVDTATDQVTFAGITNFSQFLIAKRELAKVTLLEYPLVFSLLTTEFNAIDVGFKAIPCFTDLDGNGLLDMILGEDYGTLFHYEQDAMNPTVFNQMASNFNSIDVGDAPDPAILDIDGDGLLDLIIGEDDGNLNHYEQDDHQSNAFTLVTETFSSIDVGYVSSPAFTDIDGDDLLDLVIGDLTGYLHHYEQDAVHSLTFSLISSDFLSTQLEMEPKPVFTDIDDDNLLDLMVGRLYGGIYHYEQVSPNSLNFTLLSEYFEGIDVGQSANPAFVDLDGDQRSDMVIGEGAGNMVHYEQEGLEAPQFGKLITGGQSTMRYYIRAGDLAGDLQVGAPDGFKVSLSENSGFQDDISITPTDGTIATVAYLKFEPQSTSGYEGELIHFAVNADTVSALVTGMAVDSADRVAGTALDFDGTDDFVKCGTGQQVTGNNPRTIEAWAYARSFNGGGIFQAGGGGADGLDFSFRTLLTDNQWRIQLYGIDMDVTLPGSKESWHHYCLVYDGTAVWLYYDGDLADSATKSLNTAAHEIYFGRWENDYFDGMIDEVRCWDVALDSNQIREYIHRTLTGHEGNLTGYWQFNDSTGTVLSDLVGGHRGILQDMAEEDWVISTAPVPFMTTADGNWESAATWEAGQGVPEKVWSRVSVNHNLSVNSSIELYEMRVLQNGTITITPGNTVLIKSP